MVRQALSDAISTRVVSTPTLTCTAHVPDAPVVPCLYVQPDTIDFDGTFGRGMDTIYFKLYLLVSRADDVASQNLLDEYIAGSGTASIKAALVAARGAPGVGALDGAVDDVHLISVAAYRWYSIGESTYLGAEFRVRVIGSGT